MYTVYLIFTLKNTPHNHALMWIKNMALLKDMRGMILARHTVSKS